MNYRHQIDYELFDTWEELERSDLDLIDKAFQVCENAYAPYSKFHVGAAALLSNGEVILGSNQENVAYPSGLCAERVALFYAGANFPNEQVKTLCIVAKGDLLPFEKLLSPCGSCRQVMIETENRQKTPFRVILVSQNKKTVIFSSARDLLPFAFGMNE
jgi:cytidine deaminase